MKDEIKEILDRIETASEIFDCLLKPEECTELLDYITNLQNRITELEEINKQHQELNGKLRDELENSCWDEASVRADILLEQEDYKSRCQKAIEYINHAQNYGTMAQVMPHLKPYVNGDDLLNILQDKEEV